MGFARAQPILRPTPGLLEINFAAFRPNLHFSNSNQIPNDLHDTLETLNLRQHADCALHKSFSSGMTRLLRSALVRAREVLAGSVRSASSVFRQTKAIIAVISKRSTEDSSVVEQMTVNHPDAGSNPAPAPRYSIPS